MSGYALALAVVGILVLAAALVAPLVKLYVGSRVAGAPVSMWDLVGMKLRRVNPATIVYSRIMAVRDGIDVSTSDLEALALAGGDVGRVVSAMVVARRGGVELPWVRAMAIELAGWDVLAAARGASDAELRTAGGR